MVLSPKGEQSALEADGGYCNGVHTRFAKRKVWLREQRAMIDGPIRYPHEA
jgi:hypothetical protein